MASRPHTLATHQQPELFTAPAPHLAVTFEEMPRLGTGGLPACRQATEAGEIATCQ